MPNTPPTSPQVLQEFVQNLLGDLTSDRISADAAIVAGQQYPYLRELFAEHSDEVAASMQDEEKLRAIIESLLGKAVVAVRRELPQFQVEKPDAPLSPGDIVARAEALKNARTDVGTAIKKQRVEVGQLRKTFIDRLVQNWITQTRTVIDNQQQQQLADALQTELERGLGDGASAGELAARTRQALARTRVGEAAVSAIAREVAPAGQELAVATQKLSTVTALPKHLLDHLDAPRPDQLAAVAIHVISTSNLSPIAAIQRAASLTRAAEALSASSATEVAAGSTGVFFRAFASTPAQKAFAAAADALLNQLSPFTRQEVIKATFSRALEGVLAKTDVLTERLGREFVESELFRVVVDGAQKEFARGAAGGAGAKQARGALEDVIGSLLRGPVMEPIVGSPREMILSYFELLTAEAGLAHDKKILFPDHAPVVTALGQISQGQSDRARAGVVGAAGFSSPSAFQTAVSRFAPQLPSRSTFYLILLSLGAPTTYASLISRAGEGASVGSPAVFSSAGKSSVAAVGGGINALFGSLGRGASGAVFGLGGGLIGMMFGGSLGSLFNRLRGPRQPEGFFDDTPKLIAVAIVVVIVLLFIFPSFFNARLTGQAAKHAALLVNSQSENQPDVFIDPGVTYAPPDYIDFSALASRSFDCLSYGEGVRGSQRMGAGQIDAVERAVDNYPQIKLLSCGLSCSTRKINISSYQHNAGGGYGGFAPSASPGNVIFYPSAFSYSPQFFAHTLAHETAHSVDWFNNPLAEGFHALGCEVPESYNFTGNPAEAFAEGLANYLFNYPEARAACGGKSFSYFSQAFSQCQ